MAVAVLVLDLQDPGDPTLGVRAHGQEEVAVLHGLGEDEGRVEHQRGHRGEDQLGAGVLQPGLGDGEAGQHQAHGGERDHGGQRRPAAGGVERHHAVPHRAQQQRDADDAVEGDHQGREHGVAGVCRGSLAAAEGQHHDQPHLDHRHRDRQHQGPERLAHPVGHHLGVVDRGQHGPDQHDRDQGQQQRLLGLGPGHGQQEQTEEGDRDGPLERAASRRRAHALTLGSGPTGSRALARWGHD